jgi:hypothetical protein
VVALGFAASTALWGGAILNALALAADRGPELLSIIAAINWHPELVGGRQVVGVLVRTNAVVVAVIAALAVAVGWRARLHWLEASVLGLLATLTAYKVGHQQFLIPWLFLVAALPLAGTISARRLAWLCLPLVMFLSVFQWGYAYGTNAYNNAGGVIRHNVGFIAFPLSMLILVGYFILRRPAGRGEPPPLATHAEPAAGPPAQQQPG